MTSSHPSDRVQPVEPSRKPNPICLPTCCVDSLQAFIDEHCAGEEIPAHVQTAADAGSGFVKHDPACPRLAATLEYDLTRVAIQEDTAILSGAASRWRLTSWHGGAVLWLSTATGARMSMTPRMARLRRGRA